MEDNSREITEKQSHNKKIQKNLVKFRKKLKKFWRRYLKRLGMK